MPPALLAFLARPIVKWVGGALLVVLALWFAIHTWNNYKEGLIEQGRKAGFEQAQKQFNDKIAENDRVNREVERGLVAGLQGFAEAFGKQQASRVTVENKIEKGVERQIAEKPEVFNNPACVVPADVIEGRNDIRALGPKSEEK